MTWSCGQNCPSLAGYSNMQETVHLFPSPCSVTSLRQHEISHRGDINTTGLGKYYKPKVLFSEAITSTSLILTDPTSQEVRWPQQCSSITWMWYIWDQIWASPVCIFVQEAAQIYVWNLYVICHYHCNASPTFHTYELMKGVLWPIDKEGKAQDWYRSRSTQYVAVSRKWIAIVLQRSPEKQHLKEKKWPEIIVYGLVT